MKILLSLFLEFFKIGLLALGGGMSTVPFLFDLTVKYPSWFTSSQLVDMIAISESTPGPIGINMSTYSGLKVFGIPGAIVATFSLVLPAYIIIMLVAFNRKFLEHKVVKTILFCLRPFVIFLFVVGIWNIFKITFFKNWQLLPNFANAEIKGVELFMFFVFAIISKVFPKIPSIIWVLLCGLTFVIIL